MSGSLETFLAKSPIAKRVKAEARIVVRRFTAAPREVDKAIAAGRVSIDATPVCELVVGERTIARGEIITEDGANRFRVTEVIE